MFPDFCSEVDLANECDFTAQDEGYERMRKVQGWGWGGYSTGVCEVKAEWIRREGGSLLEEGGVGGGKEAFGRGR